MHEVGSLGGDKLIPCSEKSQSQIVNTKGPLGGLLHALASIFFGQTQNNLTFAGMIREDFTDECLGRGGYFGRFFSTVTGRER